MIRYRISHRRDNSMQVIRNAMPNRRHVLCLVLLGALRVPLAMAEQGIVSLQGTTMGTTYWVKLAVPEAARTNTTRLQPKIDMLLEDINDRLSTYRHHSELSRFNRRTAATWIAVSEPFMTVVTAAQRISAQTAGAFDITVGPLVNLWGFGPEPRPPAIPEEGALAAARARVGFRQLEVRQAPPGLRKARGDLSIDLSAIAPGYAVEQVGALLEANGFQDYMVELGGEIRTLGHNAAGAAWQIGITQPTAVQRIALTVPLSGLGLASAGSYRTFFEVQGRRYSHDIDPATGWPVAHALLAVTVVHPSTMAADAYATALQVLGPKRGPEVAAQLGLAAVFFVQTDARVQQLRSAAFIRQFGSE